MRRMGPTEPKEIDLVLAHPVQLLVTIALNPTALLAPFAVWVIMIRYQFRYDTR